MQFRVMPTGLGLTALAVAGTALLLHAFLWHWKPERELLARPAADGFFGSGRPRADNVRVLDFQIRVESERLEAFTEGLRRGMAAAPDALEETQFASGFNAAYLRSLNESVLRFDWRQHEHFLNTFQHYMTEVEGVPVHFLRHDLPLKKKQRKVPLLLVHGFASSFWDFYKVIPVLANPSRFGFDFGAGREETLVFDVIVPSLPGCGFSGPVHKGGLGAVQSARMLGKLMQRLDHSRYFVHGSGALGAEVATALTLLWPQAVQGVHVANPALPVARDLLLASKQWLATRWPQGIEQKGSAFAQSSPPTLDYVSRPQTFGAVLETSPFALVTFLLDRWAHGINHPGWHEHPQGGLQAHNTVDELLTQAHLHWLPGSIASCLHLPYFSAHDPLADAFAFASVSTPSGILVTERTPYTVSEFLYRHRFLNVSRFTHSEGVGEFVAVEKPHLLAAEIFSFVELVLL